MSANKYYWLKLKKDFFKRHDIRIIESMPSGHEMVLFYIQLILESLDHDGRLRFSESLPYSSKMLAVITSLDVQTVDNALCVLKELNLISIDEEGTIILENFESMVGYETEWARQKREWREKKGLEEDEKRTSSGQSADNVLPLSDKSKSKSKSKSKERNTKERKFECPTLEDVRAYVKERNSTVDPQHFFDYYEVNGWKDSKGNPVKNWKQKLITWEKHDDTVGHCPTPKNNPYEIDWSKV